MVAQKHGNAVCKYHLIIPKKASKIWTQSHVVEVEIVVSLTFSIKDSMCGLYVNEQFIHVCITIHHQQSVFVDSPALPFQPSLVNSAPMAIVSIELTWP